MRFARFAALAALLYVSYGFNGFELQPFRWTPGKTEYHHNGFADYWGTRGYVPSVRTETFQQDSEREVLGKIGRAKRDGVWSDCGLLVGFENPRLPYYSQFGLQGQLLSAAYERTERPLLPW